MPKRTLKDLLSTAVSTDKYQSDYETLADFVKERMPRYEYKIYPHQERWFQSIVKNNHTLILTPRNHAKTETMGVLIPIYFMCINHDIKIKYVREKESMSEEVIRRIKDLINANPELGLEIGEPNKTTKFSINRNISSTDVTFLGTGIESGETGGRADLLIFDDIETHDNTQNENHVSKHLIKYRKVFYSMGDKNCKYIFIGTKQMDKDIYYHISRDPMYKDNVKIDLCVSPQMPKIIIDGVENNVVKYHTDEDLSNYWLLWPEVRDWDWVIKEYASLGPRIFMTELQQQVPSWEDSPFKMEWLKYYSVKELPDNLKIYIGMDPAATEGKEKTSYTAIVVIGVHDAPGLPVKVYILDTFKDKIAPIVGYKKIQNYISHWNPIKIYIENNAFQAAVVSYLRGENIENAYGTQTRIGKGDRMQQLSPLFERGVVYINEDMIDFIQEYNNFRYETWKHDADLLDAFEICIREVLPQYGLYGGSPVDFTKMRVFRSSDNVSHGMAYHMERMKKHNFIRPRTMRI